MAEAFAGLASGLLLGAVMKKYWFCLTGLIRDIYLLGYKNNIAELAALISIQAVIYQCLVLFSLIRGVTYVRPVSLTAIAAGSFLFGVGAVLSGGCLTKCLIMCGEGTATGLISLTGFVLSASLLSAGPLQMFTYRFLGTALVRDPFGGIVSPLTLAVAAVAAVISVVIMDRDARGHSGGRSHMTGLILIAVIMGGCFLISDIFGRHHGVAIAMPILSWVFKVIDPETIIGGCNTYDQKIGWASFLVLGIIAGSAIVSVIRKEWRFVRPKKKAAAKAFAGGLLMGAGAIWGQGCLLANGIVATSQGLLKGWWALIFLTAGIWCAARVFILGSGRRK